MATLKLLTDKATLTFVVVGEKIAPFAGEEIAKLGFVEQTLAAVLEFLGEGAPVEKSVLFELLSVHQPFNLIPEVVFDKVATAADPS